MSAGGTMPAGSGRYPRLDPFSLPVRFHAADAVADERVRVVEIYREGVVLRRSVHGMRIAVSLPVSSYLGVAMRLFPPDGSAAATVAVTLEHSDPALSVPLFAAADATDLLAEWRLWARTLGVPLLVVGDDGKLHEPFLRLGALQIDRPCERVRRRGALKYRRPRILMRRKLGLRSATTTVHHEREIIARN
jgi:hypothetical protein